MEIGLTAAPIVLSIFSLPCYAISCEMPWIEANVEIDAGLYNLVIPIQLGLWKCFSPICDDFDSSKIFSTIPLPQPPAKNNLSRYEKHEVEKFTRSFQVASIIAFTFLALAALTCMVIICFALYRVLHPAIGSLRDQEFYSSSLRVLVLLNFMVVASYISCTSFKLNGGSYLGGLLLILLVIALSTPVYIMVSMNYAISSSTRRTYTNIDSVTPSGDEEITVPEMNVAILDVTKL